ncbi:MAG: RNA polymerase sigma factor [Thermoanaerobaculia bacterium]|nr:RNA polymerase sigma factor [Thermoanaerobaculia bacterium]
MAGSLSEADVAELGARLERAVVAVCPAWLADRRDDVVQAAVVKVLELQRRSEGDRRFSASYLWRVAHSALVDEIRRIRRRGEEPLEENPVSTLAATSPNPESEAYGRELGRQIEGCLARLVRPRRRAVTLYLLGHSVPEAARLLGEDRKRVENLVYRALADLRRCLEQKEVSWSPNG